MDMNTNPIDPAVQSALDRIRLDIASGGAAAEPGPVASFGKRDRVAEAPLVLRAVFDRWAQEGFKSVQGFSPSLAREFAEDLICMTTQVLANVRRTKGWSEDEVVPRTDAWRAIQEFFELPLPQRLTIDPIFRTYPDEKGDMARAAQDLALDVLSGRIG